MSERQIENTIPVLAVRDLDRSIAFYKSVLGFEVEWNAGVVCSVARDRCSIMLQVGDSAGSGTVWLGRRFAFCVTPEVREDGASFGEA